MIINPELRVEIKEMIREAIAPVNRYGRVDELLRRLEMVSVDAWVPPLNPGEQSETARSLVEALGKAIAVERGTR